MVVLLLPWLTPDTSFKAGLKWQVLYQDAPSSSRKPTLLSLGSSSETCFIQPLSRIICKKALPHTSLKGLQGQGGVFDPHFLGQVGGRHNVPGLYTVSDARSSWSPPLWLAPPQAFLTAHHLGCCHLSACGGQPNYFPGLKESSSVTRQVGVNFLHHPSKP